MVGSRLQVVADARLIDDAQATIAELPTHMIDVNPQPFARGVDLPGEIVSACHSLTNGRVQG
jgi:hypothetical protein